MSIRSINEGNRDGQQYWIPFARSTPLFYYNKELFTEAGLTDAPKTWDEFVAVAPNLVTKDGDTITRSAFAHPNSALVCRLAVPGAWSGSTAAQYSDAEFNILINQGGSRRCRQLLSTIGCGRLGDARRTIRKPTSSSGLTAAR